MKRILILFIVIFNLKAIEFALIDSFEDAPNSAGCPIFGSDCDNDGLSEIIFASDSSVPPKIVIYERNFGGGFSRVQVIPTTIPNPWVFRYFGIGDFDNDGNFNVLVSYYSNNFIEYFDIVESPGLHSYPDSVVWSDSLYIFSNSIIFYTYSGNLDNDGKNEILIYKGDATDLLIYENQGDNNYVLKFHKDYSYGIPSPGFVFGDVDQDGVPEAFFPEGIGSPTRPLKVFEVAGDDSIAHSANAYIYLWETGNLYDAVFCGDLNQNGKPEVMIHGTLFIDMYTNRDDIWIIEATGDNQYQLIWCDSLYTPANQEMGCASSAGDVDGDGIPEIVLSLTTGVRIIKYIPGQGYTYIWQKYYAYNTGNISTAVYDINGNGINDVILAVQHQEEHRVTYIYEMVPSVSEKYKKISPYFYAFPDITSDSIKIFYSLKTKKPADFYIYNILGEKLYFKKIKPEGKLYLSLKELKLKPGIYFLRINSEDFKKIDKVIFLRK